MPDPEGSPVSAPPAATEAMWGEYGRRLLFLRHVGLFHGASSAILTPVAAALKLISAPAGTVVCREGEPGDQFFLIESGTLLVLTEIGGMAHELARLGPGEFFGEMALLRQGRRTATVRAETAVRLWSLTYADFQELLDRDPQVSEVIRRAAQLREQSVTNLAFEVEHRNLAALAEGGQQLRIGRDRDNELVFSSRLVSRHHAVVEWAGESYHLRDLGSNNGTYVNGIEVRNAVLQDGDEIWVANERLIFDRRQIQRLAEPHGVRVDATNLSKVVKGGKTLLHDITLSILPGEFVAIVGGSGAGKTTLMDALSGVRRATSGRVLYNGRDYYRNIAFYRNVLGYVPQDDIIHTELPVRVTLRRAAQLRLPADTTAKDLDAAVDEALQTLGLASQADIHVKRLSGGQRKRTSIGVELLTQPRIFFLDEPTSGLDPATDMQMMRLLRRLADDGTSIILTTHATKNVALCDKVVFLARGGYLAFIGTPQRALQYFNVDAFDEIYDRLANELTPEEWSQHFRASSDYAQSLADQPRADQLGSGGTQGLGGTARTGGPLQQLRQFVVLSARNFDIIKNNPANIPPLIGPAVIFILLLLALFRSGAFDRAISNPTTPVQLLFLVSFTVFLFGLLFGVQEVVKETAIFRRERMVNLGVLPYVLSKTTFLAPLLVVLSCVMLAVLRVTGRMPPSGFDVYGKLLLTLVLTAFAGLSLALFSSSISATPQQATDTLSLWIMPQVLLSGALFAVPSMTIVGRTLSRFAAVRWAFEATGQITDLNDLFLNGTSPLARPLMDQYQTTFSRNAVQNWAILLVFILVPFVLTCLILRRKGAAS